MIKAGHQKNNGVYHTPNELARFIASISIKKANTRTLDPCYGEGSLLLAAQERMKNLGCNKISENVFGFDIIHPPPAILDHLSLAVESGNLVQRDFFCQNRDDVKNFDLVLMNPPFVRHHLLPKMTQDNLRRTIEKIYELPRKSDLWAYFIVYATNFVRPNGSLAAILPWTFLHADYAKHVRIFLLEKFGSINVFIIGRRLFEGTEERVIVLLANEFGHNSSNISVSHSLDIPCLPVHWHFLAKDTWIDTPWNALTSNEAPIVLSSATRYYGFEPLGRFAKIRIGTVTGANGFFTLERRKAEAMNLPGDVLVPIAKRSNQLDRFIVSTKDRIHDVMLLIPEDYVLPRKLKSYIAEGQGRGLNNRYHTGKRAKWYCVNKETAPDAFLPYMTKEVPFLAMNPERCLSTNTIHGLYFADTVCAEMKQWIQMSMLTSPSQLSIEMSARTYGGGVLKIEPSDAARILVYTGNGKMPPAYFYNKLNRLLIKGERLAAIHAADDWFVTNGLLSQEIAESANKCYTTMRNLRLA